MNQDLRKNWEINGSLILDVEMDDFLGVIELVNEIAEISEEMNHHPNLYIHDYNKLQIEIYTHDEDEITEKDFELAREIEKII